MSIPLFRHPKDRVMMIIETSEPNSIFFISDFAEIGSPETIRKIFFVMMIEGKLERVGKGIYIKPKESRFGKVPVPLEKVAYEIAQRDNCEILPTGSTAANMIGLSTQIPMNMSYLTSGSTRNVKIGERHLHFRHASPKNFAAKGKVIPILIQGLKEIGEGNLSEEQRTAIKRFIDKTPDPFFEQDLLLAPMWIRQSIQNILSKSK